MESAHEILPAVVLLGTGILAILLARATRLSPIVGFLLAGAVIGEHGLGLIADGPTTHLLAELGVAFLLFDIGLHFSVRDAIDRRRDILGLGPLQVVLCAVGLAGAAMLLDVPFATGLIVSAALALSSTAVVARVLAERNQQTCPLGRSATAVLIFQDIAAIFLLVLASAFDGGSSSLMGAALSSAWKTLAAVATALVLGRLAAHPTFRALALARNEEILTGTTLFAVLATAWATAALGLSLTLGAFLAGMILSDTPYRHLIQAEVRPFRNLLLGFFFMSVGMALDASILVAALPRILVGVVVLIAIKTGATFVAARLNGWTNPGASQLSFLLAQGSEFALVVFAIPVVAREIGAETTAVLVASVALSLAITPFWSGLGMRLARRIAKGTPSTPIGSGDSRTQGPFIVFGLDPIGRFALDTLEEFEVPTIAVETDPERFLAATADGYSVAFGNVADLRIADSIGATRASAIVLSKARYEISRELTPVVRQRYPQMGRFVSLDGDDDKVRYEVLGMHPVVSRGEPQGVELATALLRHAGIDEHAIEEWLEKLRRKAATDEPGAVAA